MRDNNNILPVNISQIPDSVSTLTKQNNTIQDTSTSVTFGMQRQTLISVESADTINEVISIPTTLQIHHYKQKEKPKQDTLKYFVEYVAQLSSQKKDSNILPLLNTSFVLKPDITKYKNLIVKNNTLTTPNVFKEKKQVAEVPANKKHTKSIKKQNPVKSQTILVQEQHKNLQTDYKPNGWFIGFVILTTFIFAWVRLFFYNNYNTILKSSYNYNNSVKFFKEENSASKRVSFFLNFIFFLNISLFIYLAIGYLNIKTYLENLQLLGVLFFTILLIYIIKNIAIKIVGYIFNSENVASEYISNIWLYNKILGLSLLPIIITLPYINTVWKLPLIYIGLSLIPIFFVFRIIRSFQIVFRIKLSIIYWFLYLCTLEILPVFVLSKFF